MSSVQARSERFTVLDSWRGIAACCIALIHFQLGVNSHVSAIPFFAKAGFLVDFFFVLSGFVIFANYADRLANGFGFWRFMLLRFGRLYPIHLFMLAVFVGFELVQTMLPGLGSLAIHKPFSQPGETVGFVFSSLSLTQAMGFFDDGIVAFNTPSWSISTEFYAYAVFAALLVAFKQNVKMALVFVFLGSFAFLFSTEIYLSTTFKYGFVRCLYSFSAGALLWYVFTNFRDKIAAIVSSPKIWSFVELIAVLSTFLFMSYGANGFYQMLVTPLFMAVILIFSFENGLLSKLLKLRAFVTLGTLSYSIYMVHSFAAGKTASVANYIAQNLSWPVTSIADNGQAMLGASTWQGDVITVAYMAVVLGASFVTYRLIEEPGRKFSRRLAKGDVKIRFLDPKAEKKI